MSEDLKPYRYEPISLSSESTVVAEFVPDFMCLRESVHQSEAELERDFIAQLQKQAYDYLPITSEAALIDNLRRQMESLNKIEFSDAERQRFFSTCIAGANNRINADWQFRCAPLPAGYAKCWRRFGSSAFFGF